MYRSKRIKIMCELVQSGFVTCNNQGQIFKNGKLSKEHFDYDGYKAIYLKGVELPSHIIIAYVKFGSKAVQEGIVTRHLNGKQLDNNWDNIDIGTPKDNVSDIPKEIKSRAAKERWRSRTFEERQEITRKSYQNTSKKKIKQRSLKAQQAMTFEDRSKGYKTRKIIISDEVKEQINYLKDDYTMNDLSLFFDLPLSQIKNMIIAV